MHVPNRVTFSGTISVVKVLGAPAPSHRPARATRRPSSLEAPPAEDTRTKPPFRIRQTKHPVLCSKCTAKDLCIRQSHRLHSGSRLGGGTCTAKPRNERLSVACPSHESIVPCQIPLISYLPTAPFSGPAARPRHRCCCKRADSCRLLVVVTTRSDRTLEAHLQTTVNTGASSSFARLPDRSSSVGGSGQGDQHSCRSLRGRPRDARLTIAYHTSMPKFQKRTAQLQYCAYWFF